MQFMKEVQIFDRSRAERISHVSSLVLSYLETSVVIDSFMRRSRIEPENFKVAIKRLIKNTAALEHRRVHSYELPPVLARFDRDHLLLRPDGTLINESVVDFLRVKPLGEFEQIILEGVKQAIRTIP